MAHITIITDTNSDCVWIWELVKKLGYRAEVVFDSGNNNAVRLPDELLQSPTKTLSQLSGSRKTGGFSIEPKSFPRKDNSKNSRKRK